MDPDPHGPHSVYLLDPDPHSICGFGSRRDFFFFKSKYFTTIENSS